MKKMRTLLIINYPTKHGVLYRRYNKKGKVLQDTSTPCCPADPKTGHHPYWIVCDQPEGRDKFHVEAYSSSLSDGTYELCGPKLQGNPEKFNHHVLNPRGGEFLPLKDFTFDSVKAYLIDPANDIEEIVFHDLASDKMCKIRKSDVGIKR